MRLLTEYELAKILNKIEINYAQKMKNSSGETKSFNIHGIYTVREIRNKINKYLDTKYEK
tara:strand:- start:13684 stop:13863 length:180 start_codon:yes stop_codon:yes gene_type:complete